MGKDGCENAANVKVLYLDENVAIRDLPSFMSAIYVHCLSYHMQKERGVQIACNNVMIKGNQHAA